MVKLLLGLAKGWMLVSKENENAQLHEIESNAQQGFVHLDLLVLELHLSQKLLDK